MAEKHENIVSIQKIIANVKRFWWLSLLTFVFAAAYVCVGTLQTYRSNVAYANQDSYIGSATVYLKSENDKDMRAYGALLSSTYIIDGINNALEKASLPVFTTVTDKLSITSMSDSTAFGITVLSVGEERTKVIGIALVEALQSMAEEEMKVQVSVLSRLKVNPCIRYADGSYKTVSDVSQRKVSLTLRDFLAWRKMIIMAAGLFLGVALIFVAALFDEKVRSEEEIEYMIPGAFFGSISGKEEASETERLLLAYLDGENMNGACLVPVRYAQKDKCMVPLKSDRIDFTETQTSANANVFIVALGKDSMKDVKRAVNIAKIRHQRVIGYITI